MEAGRGYWVYVAEPGKLAGFSAVIMSRLVGLEADPESAGAFGDIEPGAWYRGMVGAAVRAGLVAGTGPGRFDPRALVTREQAATMLGHTLAWSGAQQVPAEEVFQAALGAYRDAGAISSWARAGVALAIEKGLMQGRTVNEFVPAGNCTRAEAAVVLYRLFQKLD